MGTHCNNRNFIPLSACIRFNAKRLHAIIHMFIMYVLFDSVYVFVIVAGFVHVYALHTFRKGTMPLVIVYLSCIYIAVRTYKCKKRMKAFNMAHRTHCACGLPQTTCLVRINNY